MPRIVFSSKKAKLLSLLQAARLASMSLFVTLPMMTEKPEHKKPSNYGGFVLRVSLPAEADAVLKSICSHVQFSKHVSTGDIKPRKRELCLLRCNAVRDSIWLCRLSKRDATGECLLIFTDPILLQLDLDNAPLPLRKELEQAIAKGQDRLRSEIWEWLIKWIGEQNPQHKAELEELERLRLDEAQAVESASKRIIAEQWDATGAALDFGGFSRTDYLPPLKREILERGESFVLNLAGAKTLEEDILPHEMRNIPGWELFEECRGGVVRLHRPGRSGEPPHELTVVNANKKVLEECLGVDLILHHSAFNSCVLVQYKRLSKSGYTWGFNLNDEQLCKQLEAIALFKKNQSESVSCSEPHEYRIGGEPFFIKFVQDEISDSQSTSLFKGWYVPVDYLELLKASEATKGPAGGRRLTSDNVQRWFSNTAFAPLVASGWVGTRAKTTLLINEMINASLAGNRSLVFAVASRGE